MVFPFFIPRRLYSNSPNKYSWHLSVRSPFRKQLGLPFSTRKVSLSLPREIILPNPKSTPWLPTTPHSLLLRLPNKIKMENIRTKNNKRWVWKHTREGGPAPSRAPSLFIYSDPSVLVAWNWNRTWKCNFSFTSRGYKNRYGYSIRHSKQIQSRPFSINLY